MEDIARASGITKLIVYRHFASKEALYRAVLEQVAGQIAREFAAAVGTGIEPGAATRAFLTVGRADPAGFRLLWRHAVREPEFAAYASELRARTVAAARALLSTRLGHEHPLLAWAAETAVSYLVESVLHWLDLGDPAADEAFVGVQARALPALVGSWGDAPG